MKPVRAPTPARLALAVAALALTTGGCVGERSSPADRAVAAATELPAPDLSAMDPSLAAWLEQTRDEVLGLAQRSDQEPAELALAYGSLARLYHTFELRDAAVAAYGEALRRVPEEFRWVYLRGLVEIDRGNLEQALADLERGLEIEPESVPARLRLGEVEIELDRPEAARTRFAAVLERQADSAAAHFGLGRAAAALGETEEAVRNFERALELQPAASVVHYPLAQEYRRQGRLALAERHLRLRGNQPVGFPDPPLDELSEIKGITALEVVQQLAQRQDEIDAESLLGFALTHLAGMQGAAARLEEIVAAGGRREGGGDRGEPAAPTGTADAVERARLHFVVGGLWVDAGNDAAAGEHFGLAVALDPQLVEAQIKLGNLLARRGDFQAAVEHYDRALELSPRQPEARLKRATALVNLGEQARARADLAVVLEREPGNVIARVRYAQSLEAGGDLPRAAAYYAESLALELDDQARSELHAARAAFFKRQGRFEAAIEEYRAALQLDPARLPDRRQLAALLGHVGRLEEAAAEYEGVIAEQPRDEGARLGGVAARLLLGDYAGAGERLEEGLLVLPDSPSLRHLMARLLAAAPRAELRDGRRALALAEGVLAAHSDPRVAETVAMAAARSGDFERAVAIQERVVASLGSSLGSSDSEARLELYRRRQPFAASSPQELLVAPAGG